MSKVYNDYRQASEFNKNLCSLIAMEECSELVQAISKAKRGKIDKDNMAEEIADVMICMEWICDIYDISQKEILKWLNLKSERIVSKLNRGEFK